MEIKLISYGKDGAEVVVITKDVRGRKSSQTRHLFALKTGRYTDRHGNVYANDGGTFKVVSDDARAA